MLLKEFQTNQTNKLLIKIIKIVGLLFYTKNLLSYLFIYILMLFDPKSILL